MENKHTVTGELNKKIYANTNTATAYANKSGLYSAEEDIFRRYFFSDKKILDLGCGAGRTTIHLWQKGLKVVGVDNSTVMIDKARKKFPQIKFTVADARRLPYQDNFFDYVLFSFNGLGCLYPDEARVSSLKEIRRVLKSGGLFAFSLHNSLFIPNNLSRIIRFLRTVFAGRIIGYRYDYQEYGKVLYKFTSPMQTIRELKINGFKYLEIDSKLGDSLMKITFCDPYPYYVFMK